MKKQYRGGDCLKRGVGRGLGQFVDLRWGGLARKRGWCWYPNVCCLSNSYQCLAFCQNVQKKYTLENADILVGTVLKTNRKINAMILELEIMSVTTNFIIVKYHASYMTCKSKKAIIKRALIISFPPFCWGGQLLVSHFNKGD